MKASVRIVLLRLRVNNPFQIHAIHNDILFSISFWKITVMKTKDFKRRAS